ncbi:biotin/lipoyl-containing protein, partial [Streptomyces sp. NPDC058272]|uniref:biotin/lipoyl-containing protein n=1 Tax=Streptomyces sp. NPDC058272 TaxID=3346415 RepID=UPI0036ED0D6A
AEAAPPRTATLRVFDAHHDVEQMRPPIDAVRQTGTAIAEVALCYTADLSDPSERLYTLDYYLRLAEQIVAAGAHVLAIKDMAGLLRAPAAATLVAALRREFDLPVHVHTHDTAGGQLATYLAAIQAGADAVDGAVASMAGTTSQPSLSAIVAATDYSERPTGLNLKAVGDLEPYWESVRKIYAPFEAGLASPTGRVYHHEIPGGQLSNLRTQAIALGLGDRFEEIEAMYAAADRILGHLVKVTPSSKVVGDLALHLVGAGVAPEEFEATPDKFDIPDSVIGFLRGELGNPPGGWPEPFRTKALAGRADPKPPQELTPDDRTGLAKDRRGTLNRLLFAGPTRDYETHRQTYGDTSVLDSKDFFYGLRPGKEYAVDLEPGVRLLIELQAIGEADERGMRTVMSTLNGQLRPIQVRDTAAASDVPPTEKADRANPGHVAAPFAGVVTLAVAEGDEVAAGAVMATIEAMKMEAAITAPKAGKVSRLAINKIQQVEGGDLLVEIA